MGVAASGFASLTSAGQAVNAFTSAVNDGSLKSQMLFLSGIVIASSSYTQQPIITTPSIAAVDAPAAEQSPVPGMLLPFHAI